VANVLVARPMQEDRTMPRLLGLLTVGLLLIPAVVMAQPVVGTSPPPTGPAWLGAADAYVKVFGAVLTGLGTLFGLPLVILNFRKTRAEIRKLEAETASLEAKGTTAGDLHGGTSITVADSRDVNIQVLADPRFLGPLLLLLDFILAWIVLTLADYFLGLFRLGELGTVLLGVLGGVLLFPIAKEARRVRAVLRSDPPSASGVKDS
jgi:hypothetical protein